MTSWPAPRENGDWKSRLALQTELTARAATRSPEAFRWGLLLPDGRRWATCVEPWQDADFAALDRAFLELAGQQAAPRRGRRVYLERPRGHSKTTDVALQLTWLLCHARVPRRGVVVAADREQGELLLRALNLIVQTNPLLCPGVVIRKSYCEQPQTGVRVDLLSSDVGSSWGLLPDFVICDELCHWTKDELWHSLISSAAKKPDCAVMVMSNAGVGMGWQWLVRETARCDPDWYFSTLDGPHASWISAAVLDEQRRLLPAGVYDRLWNNRWQHAAGGFVTLAEAAACCDPQLQPVESGEAQWDYVAAIDFGSRQDYTVGVIVHHDGRRIVVDRLDVAVPRPDEPIHVRWVNDWIDRVRIQFPRVEFVCDEYQLLGVIQDYETRCPIRRFDFSAGKGNHRLALQLRRLILERQLAWYPDCGAIATEGQRDDLETELASVVVRESSGGRMRIDHTSGTQAHDDRVFALGAACLSVLESHTGPPLFEVIPPGAHGFDW